MLSEVVTCNCVCHPGGHAESNPRPSEEGVSFYHVLPLSPPVAACAQSSLDLHHPNCNCCRSVTANINPMTLNLWHKHTQPALCPLLAAKLTPVHNGGHARWHCGRSTRSTADCYPKDRFEPSNVPGNVTLSVLEPRDDSAAGAVSAVNAMASWPCNGNCSPCTVQSIHICIPTTSL